MTDVISDYQDAVEWVFGRINYERAKDGSYSSRDFKLDRMHDLLERLGSPQTRHRVVHIAGTKGKGSTASMVAAMLTGCGMRTGLVTSPHVARFEERLTVDGEQPSNNEFLSLVQRCADVTKVMDAEPQRSCTFFEIATALAWLFFEMRRVEQVVLEVGLGGRLDATNVCTPAVCVITNISLDHTSILGKTTASIAREKAGIIKPGVPVISGVRDSAARDVIREVASDSNCDLQELDTDIQFSAGGSIGATVVTPTRKWEGVKPPLIGEHQIRNAALALAALDVLQTQGDTAISTDTALRGLKNVICPLRIEVIDSDPIVIIDAAHNAASCQALADTLKSNFTKRPRTLIFAATGGKDVSGMLRILLPQFDEVVLTQYSGNPRFVPVQQLAQIADSIGGNYQIAADVDSAWKTARARTPAEGTICITGSFFVAAEMRDLLTAQRQCS